MGGLCPLVWIQKGPWDLDRDLLYAVLATGMGEKKGRRQERRQDAGCPASRSGQRAREERARRKEGNCPRILQGGADGRKRQTGTK